MSDIILGVAVLEETDGYGLLHILCDPTDHPGAKPFHHYIPVRVKGTPENNPPQWEYRVTTHGLNVTPSVRISTTDRDRNKIELFHNEGEWNVLFQRFDSGRYGSAYEHFKSVNAMPDNSPEE